MFGTANDFSQIPFTGGLHIVLQVLVRSGIRLFWVCWRLFVDNREGAHAHAVCAPDHANTPDIRRSLVLWFALTPALILTRFGCDLLRRWITTGNDGRLARWEEASLA